MKSIDRAYLAGIIDGEGSIMLIHVPAGGSNKTKWEYWNLVISIANTDKRLIDWLQAEFPEGHLHTVPAKGNCRKVYQWRVCSKKAERLLHTVRPYLKLKAGQAEVALKMIGTHKLVGRAGHPPETVKYRRQLAKEMQLLNKRGR